MRYFSVFFFCLLFLLTSCGSPSGPTINPGNVTENLSLPISKDFFITAEVLINFSDAPDDKKTAKFWNELVRPATYEAMQTQWFIMPIQVPENSLAILKMLDQMTMIYSKNVCDQLMRTVQTDLGKHRIDQCAVTEIKKRRISDV